MTKEYTKKIYISVAQADQLAQAEASHQLINTAQSRISASLVYSGGNSEIINGDLP
jgi:hypothetical protein